MIIVSIWLTSEGEVMNTDNCVDLDKYEARTKGLLHSWADGEPDPDIREALEGGLRLAAEVRRLRTDRDHIISYLKEMGYECEMAAQAILEDLHRPWNRP